MRKTGAGAIEGRRCCSWRAAAYGGTGVCVSDSSVRIRVGSGRDGGSARPGICGGVRWAVRGLLDVPGPPGACGVLGWGRSGSPRVGRGWWSRLAERPVASPAAVCRVAGASSWLPQGAAVRADEPGRKGNTIGVPVQSPAARLVGGAAAKKPGRGARRGASERRYQATSSDMQRLTLLAGPHPATLRDDKDLYGMQKVRGSNPLSSTGICSNAYPAPQVTNQVGSQCVRHARPRRDDAIYFDHSGDCRDARSHKGCAGRWRGAVSLGHGPDGKRIRRKVGGRTKQEVKGKLEALHADLSVGIAAPDGRYTVGQAIEDWLRDGLDGRGEDPHAQPGCPQAVRRSHRQEAAA